MTLAEEMKAVQQRLKDAGVRDIQFCFSPTVREDVASGKTTLDDVKREVTTFLTKYLNGETTPMPAFNDSKGRRMTYFDEELSK